MKALNHSNILAERASLSSVLCAFGAHNWTPTMIEAHKAHELAKAPKESFLWRFRNLFNLIEGCTALAFSVSLAVLMLGVFVWGFSHLLSWLPFENTLYAGELIRWVSYDILLHSAVAFVLFGVCMSAMMRFGNTKITGPANWEVISLNKLPWTHAFPELAVQLIEAAQTAKPDVDIDVHMLKQDKTTLDPVLEIDGQYVLVWDKLNNIVPPPV
jgi:hypothetical protein